MTGSARPRSDSTRGDSSTLQRQDALSGPLDQHPRPPHRELADAQAPGPVDVDARCRDALGPHHRALAVAHVEPGDGGAAPYAWPFRRAMREPRRPRRDPCARPPSRAPAHKADTARSRCPRRSRAGRQRSGSTPMRPAICTCPPPSGRAAALMPRGRPSGQPAPAMLASIPAKSSAARGVTASSRQASRPPFTTTSPTASAIEGGGGDDGGRGSGPHAVGSQCRGRGRRPTGRREERQKRKLACGVSLDRRPRSLHHETARGQPRGPAHIEVGQLGPLGAGELAPAVRDADPAHRDGAPHAIRHARSERLIDAQIRLGDARDPRLDGHEIRPRGEVHASGQEPQLARCGRRSKRARDPHHPAAGHTALDVEVARRGDRPGDVGDARPERRTPDSARRAPPRDHGQLADPVSSRRPIESASSRYTSSESRSAASAGPRRAHARRAGPARHRRAPPWPWRERPPARRARSRASSSRVPARGRPRASGGI